MTFLKNMFDETNTSAEAKALRSPSAFDADMSNEQASMTPTMRGISEKYVFAEYLTPKSIAYAATVNKGESA